MEYCFLRGFLRLQLLMNLLYEAGSADELQECVNTLLAFDKGPSRLFTWAFIIYPLLLFLFLFYFFRVRPIRRAAVQVEDCNHPAENLLRVLGAIHPLSVE